MDLKFGRVRGHTLCPRAVFGAEGITLGMLKFVGWCSFWVGLACGVFSCRQLLVMCSALLVPLGLHCLARAVLGQVAVVHACDCTPSSWVLPQFLSCCALSSLPLLFATCHHSTLCMLLCARCRPFFLIGLVSQWLVV